MILKINPIVYDIEKEYFKQSSVREEQRTGSFTNRQHTQKRDNQPYTRGSHCQNLSLKAALPFLFVFGKSHLRQITATVRGHVYTPY